MENQIDENQVSSVQPPPQLQQIHTNKRKILLLLFMGVLFLFISSGISFYLFMPKKTTITQKPQVELNQKSKMYTLKELFTKVSSENNLRECQYFDKCFDEVISEKNKQQIALENKIIDNIDLESSVYLGLLHGGSVSIPGIGTAYLENEEILNLEDEKWYWEIGSCATNKRVYIDAITGLQTGPVHTYVFCGGMP